MLPSKHLLGARGGLLLGGASFAYAALLVLLRGRPYLETDTGIFLTVAGRMLDGDSLYVDVIDNKDPLFYYSYAAALASGDARAPFLLDVIWIAVAAISIVLLLRALGARPHTVAVGFICLPLLLTAGWYGAGYSMLAALSLVPLIALLWCRGKFAWAGALTCVGLFFKLNMGLLLLSGPLALLLLKVPPGRARKQIAGGVAGFAAATAIAVGMLAIRGELGGYLQTIGANVAYAGRVLGATGRKEGIAGHIAATKDALGDILGFPFSPLLITLIFLAVGVFAALTIYRWPSGPQGPVDDRRVVAGLFLSSSAAAGVTLGLTAVWDHHIQMIAIPTLFLVVFLVALARPSSWQSKPVLAGLVTAFLVVALLALPANQGITSRTAASTWREEPRSATAELLTLAGDGRSGGSKGTTVAHLGENDERALGAYLPNGFELTCPEVAQYEFSSNLQDTISCIRQERPALLLVTPSFEPNPNAPDDWNDFVEAGSSWIERNYELIASSDEVGEVWAALPLAHAQRRPGRDTREERDHPRPEPTNPLGARGIGPMPRLRG